MHREIAVLRYEDNLTTERPTFVTHLECAYTGERYPADQVHNLSRAGKPLLVRYDLPAIAKALSKPALAARAPDLWRYRELLPVRHTRDIVSLGEAMTPVVALPKLAAKLGGGELLVKDEGRLPTGSFKARGLVMAVSMAKAFGIKHMAMPTNGNAGAALAAYASHAASRPRSFVPEDTPEVNVSEIGLQGATVYRVNGLIDDCGKIVGEGKARPAGSTSRPSRSPTGSKARRRWGSSSPSSSAGSCPTSSSIRPAAAPASSACGRRSPNWRRSASSAASARAWSRCRHQAARRWCAPIEDGVEHAPRWENAQTIASGIRVPQAIGDFLILRAVRESKGFAIAVSDAAITAALDEAAREEGFLMCPEGAATYAAYKQSLADGRDRRKRTGRAVQLRDGLKYPLPPMHRTLDRHKPIDFAKL